MCVCVFVLVSVSVSVFVFVFVCVCVCARINKVWHEAQHIPPKTQGLDNNRRKFRSLTSDNIDNSSRAVQSER